MELQVLQQIFSGIAIGSIYALVAVGFILIYKATDVISFAQGDIMMFGAFVAYTFLTILHVPFLLAILLTLAVMAVFGIVIERSVLRPLVGESVLSMLMVTVGVGMVIRNVAGMIWGYDTYQFTGGISDVPVRFGELALSSVNLWIIGVTIALIGALFYFFNKTKMGISMEAASQNQLAAYLMGIGVKRVFSNIWALSAIVAAVGGILLAPIHFVNYNMGFIGLRAFPAAVLGGFGSIPGAIVGGIIIGVSESLAGIFLPAGFKDIFAYIILILVLLIRPQGIFGIAERKRV
jgi:branched-chain amino acid transport system permease protein